jgi:hypothetical protein
MPTGALISIGVTALIGAYGFISAVPSGSPVNRAVGSYVFATFFLLIAIACFAPVVHKYIQNKRNRKYKIHKKKLAPSSKKENKQVSDDWYSNLQNFDLSRLTLAGWSLSLLSFIVFLIGSSLIFSNLENAGVNKFSRGEIKLVAIPILAATVAFFYLGKWALKKVNIDIYKG